MKDPRLERAGVEGFNKPKRTPSHPTKSHIVVAKDGKPSSETGERYLPEKAIKSLSSSEYAATTRAKRVGGGTGSVVKQPNSIASKVKKYRD